MQGTAVLCGAALTPGGIIPGGAMPMGGGICTAAHRVVNTQLSGAATQSANYAHSIAQAESIK